MGAGLKVIPPRLVLAEIVNLASPAIGYSSETLLFDLQYRRDGETVTEPLVVRMEPQGIPVFSRYDLKLQFRIMKTLADSDVPVPGMRWFEEDRSLFGGPFYIMDRVAGDIPTDRPPYHIEGWLKEQTPERRRAIWLNGIAAMARIHRLDHRDFDLAFLDEPALGATPGPRRARSLPEEPIRCPSRVRPARTSVAPTAVGLLAALLVILGRRPALLAALGDLPARRLQDRREEVVEVRPVDGEP